MWDRGNMKFVAAALFLGAAALASPRLAHAQFGAAAVVTVPGSIISDQPVEQATGDLDTVQLPADVQANQTTATSVTTGGGAGVYTPNGSYISGLNQQLLSGVNVQNISTLFPGWQALPANSTQLAKTVVSTALTTYASAQAVAQSQASELAGEDFSRIEAASAGTTAALAAVQANTEAVLQVAVELQYLRQLLITQIVLQSTNASENLNERAQMEATNVMQWNTGVAP